MSLRAQQFGATVLALPNLVSLAPMASVGLAGVVIVALVSSPAGVVLHARVAGVAVAAAAAGLLDDTAAATLAPSPTPLLTRRSFRIAIAGVTTGAWWAVMLVAAAGRGTGVPAAVTCELVLLLALSVLGAVLVQRGGGDGCSGAAGGLLAVGWFVLPFLPRPAWVPSPPNPLDPGAAGPLVALALLATAATVLLSLDRAGVRRARVQGV